MRLAIDGVPVVYKAVPGPLRAALVFRVGVVDEKIHERGLSHLVEHLALTTAPDQVHAFNGSTGTDFTQFVIAGDEDDIVEFFRLVSEGLRQPHLDRLDHERGILKAEASTRGSFIGDDHLIWRFGPEGMAGTATREWGALVADEDAVDAWISDYFHAGNCGLWLTGPPPKGLRLDLPEGSGRAPLPASLEESVIELPAVFGRGRPETTVSWVVPDKRGASTLGWLVSERLTTSLRHEAGLSYGSRITTERIGKEHLWQLIAVDATSETSYDVQRGVVKVLQDLQESPPTAAELKKIKTQSELARQDANAAVAHLDHWLRQTLLDREPTTMAKSAELWAALKPKDVQDLIPVALGSLLVGAPHPDAVPTSLAARASDWSTTTFKGAMVLPARDLSKEDTGILFFAKDGVSLVREEGRVISVAIADCVCAFTYDDGSVHLYSKDGLQLFIAVEDWIGRSEITRWVDALPPLLKHPLGTRRQRVVAETARLTGSGYSPTSSRTPQRSTRGYARLGSFGFLAIVIVARILTMDTTSDSNTRTQLPTLPDGTQIIERIGLPTHFKPGDCFSTADAVIDCSLPHVDEVLPRAENDSDISINDTFDQAGCDEIWTVLGTSHPDFHVTFQLQADPGLATVLCVASRNDGKPSRGTVTVRS